ncbi:hypothetical protein TraAM80_02200 [Trypanosoma rangeli]|uniref:Uncharacterized protein n=1 Tax=Trypanosoma rangeli TaxID=5698 RepID=A0A3R7M5H3_TRYRA|nr:uncharacterized protein TraAM80_02200 [Trypanosoma rangeli]RNF09402.1 hypothetical protein TraAM80_02200 [Trypanosoma rangeli]|eukprot:RNF09402.1 hypothetical protein TraAM80_02200 [Trypanosoma rangeli]
MEYLRSLFFTPDVAFSRERVRNEIARGNLSTARLQCKNEEEAHAAEVKRLDDELREKRESFAAAAKPLLEEFDDVSLAQHYYQEVSNIVTSHLHVVTQLAEREFSEFGYISKKLISVGLNLEALKCRMASGAPFQEELNTALKDTESSDLSIVATPLHQVQCIPPAARVRATAFELARAIEEAGKGTRLQEPVRGWLDLLKFGTSFSPTMLEARQVEARRAAKQFLGYIEGGEHHKALSLAEDVYARANREVGAANAALLEQAFEAFRNTVLPMIASDVFLRYARASLDASRFACVEKMLKE